MSAIVTAVACCGSACNTNPRYFLRAATSQAVTLLRLVLLQLVQRCEAQATTCEGADKCRLLGRRLAFSFLLLLPLFSKLLTLLCPQLLWIDNVFMPILVALGRVDILAVKWAATVHN